MKFWDTSAIVPLLLPETTSRTVTRFLRVHPLRTADALQLAAAFIAAEGRPSSLEVVTLDERLAAAARKEGFVVIEETDTERQAQAY
jgi:predicted nucleic acid-binding protein